MDKVALRLVREFTVGNDMYLRFILAHLSMPYRNKLQENPANEVGSPKIMLLIAGKPRFSMKRGENHNLFNGQAF